MIEFSWPPWDTLCQFSEDRVHILKGMAVVDVAIEFRACYLPQSCPEHAAFRIQCQCLTCWVEANYEIEHLAVFAEDNLNLTRV